MLLAVFVLVVVRSKPALDSKRAIYVHRGLDKEVNRGHSFSEVKSLIANFEGVHIPSARSYFPKPVRGASTFRPISHPRQLATTDDEEILRHLARHNLISSRRMGHRRFDHRPTFIPKHVLRSFRHLVANLPDDVESSGFGQ